MRWNGLASGIVFAAAAAAAWPAFALVAAPVVGTVLAQAIYGIGIAALHVFGIAPSRARGAVAAAVAVAIAAGIAAVVREPGVVALGAATAIGVARSGLLYQRSPARAIAIELVLLGGGLALARWIGTPGLLGGALALWGFFLVQSGFFLVGGARARDAAAPGGDPFVRAHDRARALLEEA